MKPGAKGGLVYSTATGRMCPRCRNPVAECSCGRKPSTVAGGPVRVRRETKARNGKSVTVVSGAPLDEAGLVALGKELRTACGAGGTVRDGLIEVQGDHCDRIADILGKRFPGVKRAGG